ncbi:Sodium/calcium exchanger protein-domain-containing protein [Pavlovales sp. CCMP2436]|nr:Sodium/calcium exchanger protein-domain-containing protein [Pavlovales sp. CCMP2436]
MHTDKEGKPHTSREANVIDLFRAEAIYFVKKGVDSHTELRIQIANNGRKYQFAMPPDADSAVLQRWLDELVVKAAELRTKTAPTELGYHEQTVMPPDAHGHEWFKPPSSVLGKVEWASSVWLKAMLFITIPNVHNPKHTKYYMLTLGLSMCWLAGQAYVMTICLNYIGCALGISQIVMGNTLGAIGTSWPNLIASLVTARQGLAGMSVCQAIGANTFNVLVPLGFLWMIQAAAGQCQFGNRGLVDEWCGGCFMPIGFQPSCPAGSNTAIFENPGSILGTCFVTYICLSAIVFVLIIFKGRIPRSAGVVFIAWYLLWVAYQLSASFNAVRTIIVDGNISI